MTKTELSDLNTSMSSDLNFIGKNIRFFRRERNWTLAALALKIGIQEGPLGRIERGVNLPSAKVLYNLTQALDVPANALFAQNFADARTAASDTDSHFVAINQEAAILPKNLLSACQEIMTSFHALEDILNVQKHAYIPLSIPFDPDYNGMDQLAYRIRNYLGVRDGVIFDYLELFENFGMRVILFPFMKNAANFEAVSFFEPFHNNAFFFINSRNNSEKQLFSLAREMGKILIFNQMKSGKIPLFPPDHQSKGIRPINPDRAAGRFAATFLMPGASVRTTASQLGIGKNAWSWDLLLRIKHRFGISVETFLYRLEELDLISNKLKEGFKVKIEEHYTQEGFSEPAFSRRILNTNGRFFDLLLSAEGVKSAEEEVKKIKEIVQEYRLVNI